MWLSMAFYAKKMYFTDIVLWAETTHMELQWLVNQQIINWHLFWQFIHFFSLLTSKKLKYLLILAAQIWWFAVKSCVNAMICITLDEKYYNVITKTEYRRLCQCGTHENVLQARYELTLKFKINFQLTANNVTSQWFLWLFMQKNCTSLTWFYEQRPHIYSSNDQWTNR